MKPEQKFNIGDRVIGIKGNPYQVTGEGSICEVSYQYDDSYIDVRLVEPVNPEWDFYKDAEFDVESCWFELLAANVT